MQMHPKKLPIGSLHSSRSLTLSRRDPTSYSDSGANWLRFVTSTGLAESHLHAQNCTSDAPPTPTRLQSASFLTSIGLAESHLHAQNCTSDAPPTPTRSNRLRFSHRSVSPKATSMHKIAQATRRTTERTNPNADPVPIGFVSSHRPVSLKATSVHKFAQATRRTKDRTAANADPLQSASFRHIDRSRRSQPPCTMLHKRRGAPHGPTKIQTQRNQEHSN